MSSLPWELLGKVCDGADVSTLRAMALASSDLNLEAERRLYARIFLRRLPQAIKFCITLRAPSPSATRRALCVNRLVVDLPHLNQDRTQVLFRGRIMPAIAHMLRGLANLTEFEIHLPGFDLRLLASACPPKLKSFRTSLPYDGAFASFLHTQPELLGLHLDLPPSGTRTPHRFPAPTALPRLARLAAPVELATEWRTRLPAPSVYITSPPLVLYSALVLLARADGAVPLTTLRIATDHTPACIAAIGAALPRLCGLTVDIYMPRTATDEPWDGAAWAAAFARFAQLANFRVNYHFRRDAQHARWNAAKPRALAGWARACPTLRAVSFPDDGRWSCALATRKWTWAPHSRHHFP